jgi:hypothetical protein
MHTCLLQFAPINKHISLSLSSFCVLHSLSFLFCFGRASRIVISPGGDEMHDGRLGPARSTLSWECDGFLCPSSHAGRGEGKCEKTSRSKTRGLRQNAWINNESEEFYEGFGETREGKRRGK